MKWTRHDYTNCYLVQTRPIDNEFVQRLMNRLRYWRLCIHVVLGSEYTWSIWMSLKVRIEWYHMDGLLFCVIVRKLRGVQV
jgi:hypothetical protein